MRLSLGEVNRAYTVVEIVGQGTIRRRLEDLGIVKGAEIRILRVAPFKQTFMVFLYGHMLAIRLSAAQIIEVQ